VAISVHHLTDCLSICDFFNNVPNRHGCKKHCWMSNCLKGCDRSTIQVIPEISASSATTSRTRNTKNSLFPLGRMKILSVGVRSMFSATRAIHAPFEPQSDLIFSDTSRLLLLTPLVGPLGPKREGSLPLRRVAQGDCFREARYLSTIPAATWVLPPDGFPQSVKKHVPVLRNSSKIT